MSIPNPMHDMGKVKKGEKASHTYSFTNTGNAPLDIELVSGCDCSIIEWPDGKIFQPGESGEIKVTFDSNREEQKGKMEKVVDILLRHEDPKTGYPIVLELKYTLDLVE